MSMSIRTNSTTDSLPALLVGMEAMECRQRLYPTAMSSGVSTIVSMVELQEHRLASVSLATSLATRLWYKRLAKMVFQERRAPTSSGLQIGYNAPMRVETATIMLALTFVTLKAKRLRLKSGTAKSTRLTSIGLATEQLWMDNFKCFGRESIMERRI